MSCGTDVLSLKMSFALKSNCIRKLILLYLVLSFVKSGHTQDRCYDTIQTHRFSFSGDTSISISYTSAQLSGNSLLVGKVWTSATISTEIPILIKRDKFDKICWAKKLLLPSIDSSLRIDAALELSNGNIIIHVVRTSMIGGENFRHLIIRLDAQGNILSSQYMRLGSFIENEQLHPERSLLKELNNGSVIFLLSIKGKTKSDLVFVGCLNSTNQLQWKRSFYTANDYYSVVNWTVYNNTIYLAGTFSSDQACDPVERVGIHFITLDAISGVTQGEKSYCQQLFPGSPSTGIGYKYTYGEFIRLSDGGFSLLTNYNGKRVGGRIIGCRFNAQLGLLQANLILDPNPAGHWILASSASHSDGNMAITYLTPTRARWGYLSLSRDFEVKTSRQYNNRPGFSTFDEMATFPLLSVDSVFSVIHSSTISGKTGFENLSQRLSRIDSLSDCNGKDSMITINESLQLNPGNWRLSEGIVQVSSLNNFSLTIENAILSSELVCRKILVPPILTAGIDRRVCIGDTLTLSATPGYQNYQWGAPYNLIVNNIPHVSVFPEVDTIYVVSADILPGCRVRDTVRINVIPTSNIHLGADTSICELSSLTLNAGNGFSQYSWSTGQNSQIIHVSAVGSYSINATDGNGCRSKDTIQILSILQSPKVNIHSQSPICIGQSDTLKTFNQTDLHLWHNGSTNNFFHVIIPGTYWVQITNSAGCVTRDTIQITKLYSPPKHFLHEQEKFCEGDLLKISPINGFQTYNWSTGEISRTISITRPGTYSLSVKDQFGCSAVDSTIVIQEDCVNRILFPSAFTPDNNGRNDSFKPSVSGVLIKYSLIVYNRWGQVVFQTNDFTKGWTGTLRGAVQNTGNFVWLCNYQFYNKIAAFQKGFVLLIQK